MSRGQLRYPPHLPQRFSALKSDPNALRWMSCLHANLSNKRQENLHSQAESTRLVYPIHLDEEQLSYLKLDTLA
jgi:hypothetical protein